MLIFLLTVVAESFADEQLDTKGITDAVNNIDIIVDKLKADNQLQLEQLKEQEELLKNGEITISDYEEKVGSLNVILDDQKEYLDKFANDYQEYKENVKKYVFKTKAKNFFPYLYALAAMGLTTGDEGEKALYALAGYGAGTLVEDTGYGLAGATTYIGAKLNLFEVKF